MLTQLENTMKSGLQLATIFSFNNLFVVTLLVSSAVVAWCLGSSLTAPIQHLDCPLLGIL